MFLGFLTSFMLPETKGKRLEEINEELEKRSDSKREKRVEPSVTEMEIVNSESGSTNQAI